MIQVYPSDAWLKLKFYFDHCGYKFLFVKDDEEVVLANNVSDDKSSDALFTIILEGDEDLDG